MDLIFYLKFKIFGNDFDSNGNYLDLIWKLLGFNSVFGKIFNVFIKIYNIFKISLIFCNFKFSFLKCLIS